MTDEHGPGKWHDGVPCSIETIRVPSIYKALWALALVAALLVVPLSFVASRTTPTCPVGYVVAGGGWERLYCAPGVPVEWK